MQGGNAFPQPPASTNMFALPQILYTRASRNPSQECSHAWLDDTEAAVRLGPGEGVCLPVVPLDPQAGREVRIPMSRGTAAFLAIVNKTAPVRATAEHDQAPGPEQEGTSRRDHPKSAGSDTPRKRTNREEPIDDELNEDAQSVRPQKRRRGSTEEGEVGGEDGSDHAVEVEAKQTARIERNRQGTGTVVGWDTNETLTDPISAARRCRQRKKDSMVVVQSKVEVMADEIDRLRRSLAKCDAENRRLVGVIGEMAMRLHDERLVSSDLEHV